MNVKILVRCSRLKKRGLFIIIYNTLQDVRQLHVGNRRQAKSLTDLHRWKNQKNIANNGSCFQAEIATETPWKPEFNRADDCYRQTEIGTEITLDFATRALIEIARGTLGSVCSQDVASRRPS